MADKKRKVTATTPEQPQKKTKKATSTSIGAEPVEATSTAGTPQNEAAVKSKTGRKRAADFLDDTDVVNTTTPASEASAKPTKKPKKSTAQHTESAASKKGKKKSKQPGGASLTADGVNGVVEHGSDSEVEIATGDVPAQNSLLAEGLHTADQEMTDEFGKDDNDDDADADQGAALLAGFDSDTEDNAEDANMDLSRTQPIPDYKKTSKKLRKAKENGSDGPGAVYVGRVPHGFYEQPMRDYFSQFGEIKRLRLSRNRKTGASKHFAFIEFESNEVAKIVADTMDNYLMFGHILKCKYAPAENLHPDVWKGANKKFRKIPHDKLEKQRLEAPKTVEQWEKKNAKEQKKRAKRASALKGIGYEIASPALKDPSLVLSQRKLEQAEKEDNAMVQDEPVAALEAPALVPEAKASKPSKKDKKNKAAAEPSTNAASAPLTEGNLDIQNADNATEKATKGNNKLLNLESKTPNSTAAATNSGSVVTDEKSTKKKKSKLNKALSAAPVTDNGDYEALSSIAVGDEAPAAEDAPTADPNNLDSATGVADAELKKRKSDRKSKKSANGTSADAKAEDMVVDVAPVAKKAGKKAKVEGAEVEKEKKPKSILKKAKKQKA